jgi:hypothetical protein
MAKNADQGAIAYVLRKLQKAKEYSVNTDEWQFEAVVSLFLAFSPKSARQAAWQLLCL